MELQKGDEVFWHDPDNGISSGFYEVVSILSESGTVESEDTILFIKNKSGSEAEVFAHELE
jgi:hypothetical protein